MKGGLVPLFAIEQNISVIGIANYDNTSGALEDLIDINNYKQPTNFEEFTKVAQKLITNKNERKELAHILKDNKLNKTDFDKGLSLILENNYSPVSKVKPVIVDDDILLNSYIELCANLNADLLIERIIYLKQIFSIKERIFLLIKITFIKGLKIKTRLINIARLLLIK